MRIEYNILKVYNYLTEDVIEYSNVYNVTQMDKIVQFTIHKGMLMSDAIIRLSPAIITFSEQSLRDGEIRDE